MRWEQRRARAFHSYLQETYRLSPQQAIVIGLRVSGTAWKVMPRALGATISTCHTHYMRARRKLEDAGIGDNYAVELVVAFYEDLLA